MKTTHYLTNTLAAKSGKDALPQGGQQDSSLA